MAKVIETNLDVLVPDNHNFNKGTEFGLKLIGDSLRKFGAGRSIVLDRNNRIIAGNKTTENCADIGMDKVIIVETDGNTLVAVKRTDIDLDSKKGREMAMADNATAAANLCWDVDEIKVEVAKYDIQPKDWAIDITDSGGTAEPDAKKGISTKLLVDCKSETELSLLFSELQDRGFKVVLK